MRAHLDWTYDKDQFGTLPQIVDDLHANGQHYIMIIVSIIVLPYLLGHHVNPDLDRNIVTL